MQGPEGRPPNVSPARKGWVHRHSVERRRCGTTLFVCSSGPEVSWACGPTQGDEKTPRFSSHFLCNRGLFHLSWKHGVSSRHKFVISPAPVCRGSGVERSAVMFYPRLPWLNNPIPLTNSNNLIRLDLIKLLNLLRSRPLHLDQIHCLTFP
jgi:hypothetical protein